MMNDKYRQFFKTFFEEYYKAIEKEDELFLEGYNIEVEMLDGELDEEGYGKWKLVPSTVTEADLVSLECELGVKIPDILKAYLSTYHHYFDEFIGRNPISSPLHEIKQNKIPCLLNNGFIAFCWDDEDAFIYCMDCKSEENKIYKIDHEVVYDLEDNTSLNELVNNMEFVSSDLFEYLQSLLSKQQNKVSQKKNVL